MNVAYIARAPFIGGAEKSLQITIKLLQQRGINPFLICPADSPLRSWAKNNDISLFCMSLDLPNTFSFSCYFKQLKLYLYLKKNRIVLIHSNQVWSIKPIQLTLRLLSLPTICHLRDPIGADIDWWLGTKVNCVIAISEHIKKEVATHMTFNNISIKKIINPVLENNELNRDSKALLAKDARKFFSIPENCFVYAVVGQISVVKSVFEVIDSFIQCSTPQDRLVIAGESPKGSEDYMVKCIEHVECNGLSEQILFVGFQSDISKIYLASNVIVMASKHEPLGRVPLEAAMYEVPSLIHAVDGLKETVVNGKTGLYFDLYKKDDLRDCMNAIKTKDLQLLGRNAFLFAKEIASPETYSKAIIELYNEVTRT